MSLCNIPLLTSFLELLHGFDSNFVWMFLLWTLTKYANEILVSYVTCTCMSYFVHFFQFLDFFLKPQTRNHSYIVVNYVYLIEVLRPQCHLALLFETKLQGLGCTRQNV